MINTAHWCPSAFTIMSTASQQRCFLSWVSKSIYFTEMDRYIWPNAKAGTWWNSWKYPGISFVGLKQHSSVEKGVLQISCRRSLLLTSLHALTAAVRVQGGTYGFYMMQLEGFMIFRLKRLLLLSPVCWADALTPCGTDLRRLTVQMS